MVWRKHFDFLVKKVKMTQFFGRLILRLYFGEFIFFLAPMNPAA